MKRIMVVYHSQEKGNTRKMAELVAQGCRQVGGVEVRMVDVNVSRVDMSEAAQTDGWALGSPDYFNYVAGGLKQFFDDLLLADWDGKDVLGRPYVGFITHGGGGKAVAGLEYLAQMTKLVKVSETLSVKGAPQAAGDIEKCIALGKALAEHVARIKKG